MALTFGRAALGFGLPFDFSLPLALGLALACGFTAAMAGPVPLPELAAAEDDRVVAAGFAVRTDLALELGPAEAPELAAAVPDLAVLARAVPDLAVLARAVPDLAVLARAGLDRAVPDLAGAVFAAVRDVDAVLGLAVVLVLADVLVDAAGVAADAVLTAAVSDLAAVVMALVALFIACMAVAIVLADDVALVAAAVIFVAAVVTLVAADETVRTADAGVAVFAEALRVVETAVARVLALVCGRRAARLDVLPLVDLVRAPLAGVRRAAVRVVVRAGTDLPPSRSITQVLFHERRRLTHPVAVIAREQWSQAARK
jgi:hypothetical protein